MDKPNPPLWRHDCPQCVPLGTFTFHDLYFCQGILGGTVLARYGNDGPEYLSTPVEILLDNLSDIDDTYPLKVAIQRAQEAGLVTNG